MKEQLVELLIKIGLFFANCDGNYDPTEKKFIHNFLRNLELNHILVPGDYDKEALEDVAPGNIDSVIAEGIFPDSSDVLKDIIDTPISPELLPPDENGNISQKTEESVGPYELHDFFLYYMMRFGYSPSKVFFLAKKAFSGIYEPEIILKWMRMFYKRFFSQQFKRSCMPDGVKVGSVALSPRGDWRMPSDASAALWINEIDNIDVKFDE